LKKKEGKNTLQKGRKNASLFKKGGKILTFQKGRKNPHFSKREEKSSLFRISGFFVSSNFVRTIIARDQFSLRAGVLYPRCPFNPPYPARCR
jgi:hypothetical protein